jgi:ankyrin repeat protein
MDNIFDLIKNKKFDILLEYIKKNDDIDLDIYDENYNYFIQYLVIFNAIDILKFILQNRTIRLDILDTDGRNLLYMPIKYNYYELLKILIEYDKKNIGMSILDVKDNNNNIGLHYCIIYDNLKAFLLLYNNTNNNNYNYNLFNVCLQYKRTNILLFLLENEIKYNNNNNIINNIGESILQSAINYDDMKVVKFIINNTQFLKKIINNKENEYGLTALHQCIVLNYNEIVIKLIENGADINSADYLGNTPLHYSIIEKNYEITEYLLLKMENKELFYSETNMNGNTALHLFLEEDIINSNINSSEGTKYKMFDILLKLIENTDINIINMDGFTSLHYITMKNLFSIPQIKKILINGKTHMNLFIINKEGLNVLDMVKTTLGHKEEFINIAVNSYYNILKTMKTYIEPWEQYCANDDLTNLLKVTKGINKHKNSMNNNSMNNTSYYCKDYIKKLILEKKRSIPTYKELNLNLDTGVYMEGCFYTGSIIDILFGLLYLNINIKNASLLLEYPLTNNKEIENYYIKMGLNYTFKMEFSNIEIVWSFMKLIYPTNFDSILLNRIKNAHSSNMTIIIPLGIEVSSGSHANIIIIDYKNKTIERFEPNGMNPPRGFYYNPSLLNTILKTKFSNLLPDYTYIPPSEYLPNIGFQMYESMEDTKCKKIGDPNGFCAVWCIWWAEQRLKYNEVKPKILAEELIKHMKFSNKSFKKLIRNYSINIVKLRDEYLKKYNINIDDWMVGKYDEEMINNLEKNVLDKIN